MGGVEVPADLALELAALDAARTVNLQRAADLLLLWACNQELQKPQGAVNSCAPLLWLPPHLFQEFPS